MKGTGTGDPLKLWPGATGGWLTHGSPGHCQFLCLSRSGMESEDLPNESVGDAAVAAAAAVAAGPESRILV